MDNTVVFVSPLSGTTRTESRPGGRWRLSLTVQNLKNDTGADTDLKLLESFLFKLNGAENRAVIKDFAYERAGPGGGTPLIKGSDQTGLTLLTDGWTASTTVLYAGDRVGVSGQMIPVVSDVTSDGSGNATIALAHPIRNAPADNASIEVDNPSARFALTNKASFSSKPGVFKTVLAEFEEDIITTGGGGVEPMPRVWMLSRGTGAFQYFSIDYDALTPTLIRTEPTTYNWPKTGFASDGRNILIVNEWSDSLSTYSWNGTSFDLIEELIGADTNKLYGFWGGAGWWVAPASGDFVKGVSAGEWSNLAIGTGQQAEWADDKDAEGVMDFRSAGGRYSGYGELFVAGSDSGRTTEHAASFALNLDPIAAPSIIDTITVPHLRAASWGWDRDTGDFCGWNSTEVYHYKINLTTGALSSLGTITLSESVSSCTFAHGFLVTMASRVLETYSITGAVATLVGSLDVTAYFTDEYLYYMESDPYSDWILIGADSEGGGIAFNVDAEGTISTTVIDLYPLISNWSTSPANGVHFMPEPLS